MSATVSPRLGFCQRCGDPTNKFRCRCGGTSKEPRIRTTSALPVAQKADPWANRYVKPHSPFSPCRTGIEAEEYSHNQPPPLSPYDPALGFGMPSRISRDLRTNIHPNSLELPTSVSPSNLAPAKIEERRASNDYTAPLITGSDGTLTKVCGSLVEPSSSRNKWACAGCSSVFARDSTLYAAPSSDPVYYCKQCYSDRYSLGSCAGCDRAVLGSTKEDGKYVKASAGIWHGRCWKCQHCGEKQGVLVGMQGRPVCEPCFDRPKPQPSPLPTRVGREELGLPEVKRLSKVGRNGAMGATIAELTKKLGQTSLTSPQKVQLPSDGSLEKELVFPASSTMARSGSLTASPPKPRPLTARFREGMDLAAFQPSYADEGLLRKGSRSRSVSPAKRVSPSSSLEAKVPGSPSLAPITSSSSIGSLSAEEQPRRKTSNGFPRPLNSPFSPTEQSEPRQGEKSGLEPVEGTVRCAVCHLLPFEPANTSGEKGEVVMVTLRTGVHLHADCFRCSICQLVIDGEKTFVKLDENQGYVGLVQGVAYAHPHCSPSIQLQIVQVKVEEGVEKQRSYRASLDPASGRSHPTHQRELKPSPTPSPCTSLRDRTNSGVRGSIPESIHGKGEVRRFQPSAGAAIPTRSTILSTSTSTGGNPAAGIYTRLNSLSSAALTTTTNGGRGKLGGMATCAFCGEKLSSLESVLGPRGTQWHKNCLICRAPPLKKEDLYGWRKKQPVICGKKLDSGAKVNEQGEVRCRDCYGRESGMFRIKP